jgi:hypothetical protein
MCFMDMCPAGPTAELDRYIGYWKPYATSHDELDADSAVQEEVRNAARTLLEAVKAQRAGKLIAAGQAFSGDASRWTHAFIVLNDNTVIEAEPGGARIGHLSAYAGRPLLVSDAPVQEWLRDDYRPGALRSTDELWIRGRLTTAARSLVGIPYSALDYAALALLHLHLPSTWVRDRVQRSGHMICSQLVDAVYARAGIRLFTDGRRPGDVMPAHLAAWAEDRQATQLREAA